MAKTIMISNNIYEELKAIKGNRSFSELLENLIKRNNTKRGIDLIGCFGILKTDNEWKKIEGDLKRGWKRWSKKYA